MEQFLMNSDPEVSPEVFHELVGKEIDLIRFVRSVSGLDRAAVINEFEEFLQNKRLSSNQIQFIEQMIEFYTQKGHLEIATLYEPPFDILGQDGIDGVFRDSNYVMDLLIEKGGETECGEGGVVLLNYEMRPIFYLWRFIYEKRLKRDLSG